MRKENINASELTLRERGFKAVRLGCLLAIPIGLSSGEPVYALTSFLAGAATDFILRPHFVRKH